MKPLKSELEKLISKDLKIHLPQSGRASALSNVIFGTDITEKVHCAAGTLADNLQNAKKGAINAVEKMLSFIQS